LITSYGWAQTGVSDSRVSLPDGPGSLEGMGENVDLDPNMGVMSYSVPIQVPQGFPSTTPQLSLNYNSGGGSSVVGMGWSMDVPNIERMTVYGLPQYTRDDQFSANGGEHLIYLPNSSPPTYRARFEKSFNRYQWHQAGDGSQGYWTIEYPNGSIGYFGATQDGTLVPNARVSGSSGTFRYMLTEMVDVFGHSMRYTYEKFGYVSLVKEIGYVYTVNPNQPRYSVRFEYEERRDDEMLYEELSDAKAGFDEVLNQRLHKVLVFSDAEQIRHYTLSYESYEESGGFTRLSKVETRGNDNELYPAVFSFQYSQALAGVCQEINCNRPYLVEMGNIGVNIGVGRATLIDINGDALPDIVDTTSDGAHRFILNEPTEDGTSRFGETQVESLVGTGSGFRLGNALVQVLDVNGDGFTDMTNVQNGRVLINKGRGDWQELEEGAPSADLASALESDFEDGELRSLRFIDYDNDKRIDVIKSNPDSTFIFRNQGAQGFAQEAVSSIGAGFLENRLELSDMNGDGLQDPVMVTTDGVRYRINYGRGQWGPWVEVLGVPVNESEIDFTSLEDINGDGLSDLVVVSGSEVKFAINQNGVTFSSLVSLTSTDIDGGGIPTRDQNVSVLFADMNGNGSQDIVWLTAQGDVSYLEIFPIKPNLISRIDNGLGQVTEIEYSTSAQQMALDGGIGAWQYTLPHPMIVVSKIDRYETLSFLRDRTQYRYHNGFYDGIEKQFRGYAQVELSQEAEESQESSLTTYTYDVGFSDPYRNGLLLSTQSQSGGRALSSSETLYTDCAVDNIPEPSYFEDIGSWGIRYVCMIQKSTTVKEGMSEANWVRTQQNFEYDGYGNQVKMINHGVVSQGGGECQPCEEANSSFGQPCGIECLGDELFTETQYVSLDNTNERWILGSPYRQLIYGKTNSELTKEILTYYDGDAFVGLPLGQLNQGKVSRVTQKRDVDTEAVIESTRNAFDEHGNIIETLDPLGTANGLDHRRRYVMDREGLRVVQTDLFLTSPEGVPYSLRRETQYEPVFDKIVESTAWMRVEGNEILSARRSHSFAYDQFGRISALNKPGNDTISEPTKKYIYELASPTSRIILQTRSQVNGELDQEQIRCMDGKGRTFQTRTRLSLNQYQVTGFTVFNQRGAQVKVYQPYVSTSDQCDLNEPENIPYISFKYDASHRRLQTQHSDEDLYGSNSVSRTEYKPLSSWSYNEDDTDESDPHYNTPTVANYDGLGRMVSMDRFLTVDAQPSSTQLYYDELGRLKGYMNEQGHIKTQSYDLVDRVLEVTTPHMRQSNRYVYNDNGQRLRYETPHGEVILYEYDGLNRLVRQWEESQPDQTMIQWTFDQDAQCAPEVCTYPEGKVVAVSYPYQNGERVRESMGYNLRGNTINSVKTIQNQSFTTSVVYDNADRIVSVVYPNQKNIDYEYDDANRLTSIAGVINTIEYNDRSLKNSSTYANGVKVSHKYDSRLRKTELNVELGSELLQGFQYQRTRTGLLREVQDLMAPRLRPEYLQNLSVTYDAWNRINEVNYLDLQDSRQLNYSTGDQILSKTSTFEESIAHQGEFRYDQDLPYAVKSTRTHTYEYDDSGRVTQRDQSVFEWDFMGRISRIIDTSGNDVDMGYGSQRDRLYKKDKGKTTLYISKSFEIRDGISTLYILEGKDKVARIESDELATQLLSDLDGNEQIDIADAWLSHAQGENILESTIDDPSSSDALLWSSIRRLLMESGSENGTTYLHHDHLGSLTLATTSAGEVEGRQGFDLHGKVRFKQGDVDESYGFTGQEHVWDFKLIRFPWRLLDPDCGRWMSVDPLFIVSSPSKLSQVGEATTAYAYVGNNPVNMIDPTGLTPGFTPRGLPFIGPTNILKQRGKQLKFPKKPPTSQGAPPPMGGAPPSGENMPFSYSKEVFAWKGEKAMTSPGGSTLKTTLTFGQFKASVNNTGPSLEGNLANMEATATTKVGETTIEGTVGASIGGHISKNGVGGGVSPEMAISASNQNGYFKVNTSFEIEGHISPTGQQAIRGAMPEVSDKAAEMSMMMGGE
jgi:RHS repeat-associated protein